MMIQARGKMDAKLLEVLRKLSHNENQEGPMLRPHAVALAAMDYVRILNEGPFPTGPCNVILTPAGKKYLDQHPE